MKNRLFRNFNVNWAAIELEGALPGPGSHRVVVPNAVYDRLYELCRRHCLPGLRTTFEDSVDALSQIAIPPHLLPREPVTRMARTTRVKGHPALRLIFDVDPSLIVVKEAWFPQLRSPNNTRDIVRFRTADRVAKMPRPAKGRPFRAVTRLPN